MGDLYYIVGDRDDTWKYVCYGKQIELYANYKELLATFMFIERCHERLYSVLFFKGSSNLEHYAMKRFSASVENWPDHVKDVSDEWLEYAEEELRS